MSEELLDRVRARIADGDGAPSGRAELARLVRSEARLSTDSAVAAAVRLVQSDVRGYGPLDAVLRDDAVTDVLVNGPDDVWADDGHGLRRAQVRFADEDAVRRLAHRLLASVGRAVDVARPFADAQLPDGVRLHVVVPPVVPVTVLSLRVLRRRPFALAELESSGSLDGLTRDTLQRLIAARVSFVVTGGTGAGKTTVLSALLGAVPGGERLVLVEDTPEIVTGHPHAVHLRTRPANAEGAGAVTMADLVRQSLRMRPDRIVVGEARGPEVVELLAALNTGHAGSASTVHANSPADLVARFVALGTMAGVRPEAIERQLVAGVGAVVHVARGVDGRRYVEAVGAVRSEAGAAVVSRVLARAGAWDRAEWVPGSDRWRSRLLGS
jgi:pilus assembly protein CpaF